jgi:O-acetyl-ADP-ribose deacetylase (regulator of RNase III)
LTSFEIVQGNIADIHADAIVNAANEQLARGKGVCASFSAKANT